MEIEINRIRHVINLIDLVRDLSSTITNPDFKSVMEDLMDDDRLTETIITLEGLFPCVRS